MPNKAEAVFKKGLEFTTASLVLSLIIIVIVAVVLRKSGHSLPWYDEVASVILAWITYLGAALAALNRAHLGFGELVAALPRKLRFLAFIAAELIVVSFLLMVIIGFTKLIPSLQGLGLASLPWVPVLGSQLALPIGMTLFIVAQLFSARRAWDDLDNNAESRESLS